VSPVSGWTGRTACELQASLRMSNESFAGHLGIAVRTVASWHQKPYIRPRAEMQQLLDAALERASPADRARFAESLADATEVGGTERLEVDPAVADALEWLDRHAGRPPGQSYRDVSSRVARADADAIRAAGARRAAVGRVELVSALASYYGPGDAHGLYSTRLDDGPSLVTSILTRPGWLDLGTPLIAGRDRLVPVASVVEDDPTLDDSAAEGAARRLAETLILGTRLVDMPLYRLLSIELGAGTIVGTLSLTHFTHYALTMDLLGSRADRLTHGQHGHAAAARCVVAGSGVGVESARPVVRGWRGGVVRDR